MAAGFPSQVAGIRPSRLLAASVAASVAYLLAMFADERLLGTPADDLILLGGYVASGRRASQVAGLPFHLLNGLLLTLAYAAIGRRRLTGAGWTRGLVFATAENTLSWPFVLLLVRANPAFKDGRLPTYNRATPWLQAWLRHAVFGLVLGSLLPRPEDSPANA